MYIAGDQHQLYQENVIDSIVEKRVDNGSDIKGRK